MAVTTTVLPFGEFEGRQVNKYIITRHAGIQVCVMNYGAAVTNLIVPGKGGVPADVVLGYDKLEDYLQAGNIYMGGICGRYANRIADAKFRINGSEYKLAHNNGVNCLHGGVKGFDKVYWEGEVLPGGDGVKFAYTSKDGEEGFPGNLDVSVTYRVVDNALHIVYGAVTDKSTPVNLTSHCYFNLAGRHNGGILDHLLWINGGQFLEVGDEFIPTGKIVKVDTTAMDFTKPRIAGQAIAEINGYDHCWVLDRSNSELLKAASLFDPESGREMTVYTTQPGIHFYSGHLLGKQMQDTKKGKEYGKYAGLCLEAQHFPDSPNHPAFPNTIVKPGELYREKTVYSFGKINE